MRSLPRVLLAALCFLSACVWFKPPADPLQRLVVERQRLIAGASAVKPNQAMQMKAEAAKLETLIAKGKAGETLDPAEVDRAIREARRYYY